MSSNCDVKSGLGLEKIGKLSECINAFSKAHVCHLSSKDKLAE